MYGKSCSSANIISAYVDGDFAHKMNDRKSISRYVFKIYNDVVFWKTKHIHYFRGVGILIDNPFSNIDHHQVL